jgi:hypothetical protein
VHALPPHIALLLQGPPRFSGACSSQLSWGMPCWPRACRMQWLPWSRQTPGCLLARAGVGARSHAMCALLCVLSIPCVCAHTLSSGRCVCGSSLRRRMYRMWCQRRSCMRGHSHQPLPRGPASYMAVSCSASAGAPTSRSTLLACCLQSVGCHRWNGLKLAGKLRQEARVCSTGCRSG